MSLPPLRVPYRLIPSRPIRFDANANGTLSKDEFKQLWGDLKTRMVTPRSPANSSSPHGTAAFPTTTTTTTSSSASSSSAMGTAAHPVAPPDAQPGSASVRATVLPVARGTVLPSAPAATAVAIASGAFHAPSFAHEPVTMGRDFSGSNAGVVFGDSFVHLGYKKNQLIGQMRRLKDRSSEIHHVRGELEREVMVRRNHE